jgi:uroporphyrinogen-III synthase
MMVRDVLVIVRPADRKAQTIESFRNMSFTLHFEDVLSYQPTSTPLPDISLYRGVVVTSIRAPQSIGPIPADLLSIPLYVVGDVSAKRAKDMGFRTLAAVAPTVEELRQTIRQSHEPVRGPLLYLRGDQVAYDLATDLKRYGYTVDEHIAYKTSRKTDLSTDCAALLQTGQVRAVLFFSRSSAAQFSNIIIKNEWQDRLSGVNALCLSPAVLECAHNLPWGRTYTAISPDLGAMVDLVRTLPVDDAPNEGMPEDDNTERSDRHYSKR